MSYNLIIIAMEEELEAFLEALPSKTISFSDSMLFFEYHNENYLIKKGDIGKGSTCFHLGYIFAKYDIKRVFNIGTSGGLDTNLKIGDVVVANEVQYFDVDAREFGYALGQIPRFPLRYQVDRNYFEKKKNLLVNFEFDIHYGLIASSDSFMTREKIARFNLDDIRPLAVEMEAAAVGQSCFIQNIPFIIIRSISDIITKPENNIDSTKNIKLCSNNCVSVLLALI